MLRIDRVLGHALIVDEPQRFNSLVEDFISDSYSESEGPLGHSGLLSPGKFGLPEEWFWHDLTFPVCALIGSGTDQGRHCQKCVSEILQNRTLMMRMRSSSGEKIVRRRGTIGAAVAAARRVTSSSPKGTGRMSRTRP